MPGPYRHLPPPGCQAGADPLTTRQSARPDRDGAGRTPLRQSSSALRLPAGPGDSSHPAPARPAAAGRPGRGWAGPQLRRALPGPARACGSRRGHGGIARPADVTCRACKRTLAWRAAATQAWPPGQATLVQMAADLEARARATVVLAAQALEFGRDDLSAALAQLVDELQAAAQSFRGLARAEAPGRRWLAPSDDQPPRGPGGRGAAAPVLSGPAASVRGVTAQRASTCSRPEPG